jgi:circadian clock protein KaiC
MDMTNQVHSCFLAKSPTGIQGLDDITHGGLPKGRPTLLCGKAGCGKTLMAMEFLFRGVTQYNEPGVFLSFEESPQELTENVASFGWNLEDLLAEKKLAIRFVQIERNQTDEAGEFDLEALFVRLGHAIDSINAKRVVLDTLEVLFGGVENTGIIRSELRRLFLWLKEKKVTAIVTAESGENTPTRHGLEEYISDCVIVLDQRTYNELATRRLQILKYRGSSHGSNEYPFLIEEQGISVLPLTSVTLDYATSTKRVSTGIARLDTLLDGQGFFRGSSILISGTAGTGKSSLCAHFAQATCHAGERCLYLAFEEPASQIIRNMRSIGIDLEPAVQQGLLKFQTLRPTLYGLELHLVNIHRLVNEFRPAAVILDPISNLHYAGTSLQVEAFMMRLIDFLKNQQVTALLTHLTPGNSALERTEVGVSSLADVWILLRDQESNGERNRLIYILKSRGMKHSRQVREFQLTSSGVELVDVYLGTGGVLAGTARMVQEAQEKAEVLARKQAIEQKQRNLERKRAVMEAQIQALQVGFETEKEELEREIVQAQRREHVRSQEQAKRARRREADVENIDE